MSVAGGGAAQGGGSSAVIIDIMANSAQLGAALQDAEKQIAASAARMGKSIDGAMQQAEKHARDAGDRMGQAMDAVIGGGGPRGGPGAGTTGGIGGRFAQMFQGRDAMIGSIATQFATSLTDDIKSQVERRGDLGDSLGKGLRESLKAIPHWAVQLGVALGEALTPVGERAGEALGHALFVGANDEFVEANAGFEEGTEYGILDYISDVFNNRTTRDIGRGVRSIANQNLIQSRQDELAALQAEQQILRMTDQRGAMFQSRMHMGLVELQTSMGTFRTGFGSPEEASARVYDAAIRQLVAMERIESIVKEIGHHARSAMRN